MDDKKITTVIYIISAIFVSAAIGVLAIHGDYCIAICAAGFAGGALVGLLAKRL